MLTIPAIANYTIYEIYNNLDIELDYIFNKISIYVHVDDKNGGFYGHFHTFNWKLTPPSIDTRVQHFCLTEVNDNNIPHHILHTIKRVIWKKFYNALTNYYENDIEISSRVLESMKIDPEYGDVTHLYKKVRGLI